MLAGHALSISKASSTSKDYRIYLNYIHHNKNKKVTTQKTSRTQENSR